MKRNMKKQKGQTQNKALEQVSPFLPFMQVDWLKQMDLRGKELDASG